MTSESTRNTSGVCPACPFSRKFLSSGRQQLASPRKTSSRLSWPQIDVPKLSRHCPETWCTGHRKTVRKLDPLKEKSRVTLRKLDATLWQNTSSNRKRSFMNLHSTPRNQKNNKMFELQQHVLHHEDKFFSGPWQTSSNKKQVCWTPETRPATKGKKLFNGSHFYSVSKHIDSAQKQHKLRLVHPTMCFSQTTLILEECCENHIVTERATGVLRGLLKQTRVTRRVRPLANLGWVWRAERGFLKTP